MPGHRIYQVRGEFPRQLTYRNGRVRLEIGELPWLATRRWTFYAAKSDGKTCELAYSFQGKWHLEQLLLGGFPVARDTPAEQIMERLVREGVAEGRDAGRRDLR